MQALASLKPILWGVVIGSILTMILGFKWGGWTTAGGADQTAVTRANAAVTAALVPICLEREKADTTSKTKRAELKAMTASYDQTQFVMNAGWATFVGNKDANRDVAEGCASALMKIAAVN